ncbi:hypothetical protein SAMN02910384_02892 [Pseudobutyrivibrio sp. ACV-2]|uniref:hypothetical protein n=1 Tax=Pseudobutyrivibrio sp. ACV-2 TaxID=1520801 RepID=UPI000896BB31|nr:hypothetical protein [Pseudobutyrivibrio sp. ACV-2]SEA97040.1 hypothetical protein SAMN02910384_02892 [Pseudobutyrivibrio sp. ACV-2]
MGCYKIVSDENSEMSKGNSTKNLFARRDFEGVAAELEKENNDDETFYINKALICHILGNYDVANEYYEKIKNNDMGYVNYLARCHRYFDYKKLSETDFAQNQYRLAMENNNFNYIVSTNGIESIDKREMQHTIYTERILNDLYMKMGRPLLHKQNDILKKQFLETVEIQEKKVVFNKKKRVGLFVTDIQRHKDSAMIYELVDCLKDYFELVIYFNNIFANKLVKYFEGICTVSHVINLYYEEINNLIYDDSIDVLIDLGELGLRNNNIALSMLENCISLHELLDLFPILLETESYYPPEGPVSKEDFSCVIGDLRCLGSEKLIDIQSKIEGNIEFESHSLDEDVFMDYFEQKLLSLGSDMSRISLTPGILPFSKYMDHIRCCKNIILTDGISYVELSEALKSRTNILLMSKNPLIRKVYETYCGEKNIDGISIKQSLIQYIDTCGDSRLYKIKNKKSRIAYFENGKEITISNTCNGDVVLLGE